MCVCILACGCIFVSVCVCVCKSELHIGEYRDWCSYIFLNNSSISFLRQGLFLDQELTGSGREADQQALGIVIFAFPGAVMNSGVKSSAASKQFTNYNISPVPPTHTLIYIFTVLPLFLFISFLSILLSFGSTPWISIIPPSFSCCKQIAFRFCQMSQEQNDHETMPLFIITNYSR